MGACCLTVRHDAPMSRDWTRLADAIKARRLELELTQVELAEAADVAEATVQNLEYIEYARSRKRKPSTMPRIEAALGWVAGSAVRIAEGGEPELLEPASELDSLTSDMAAGRVGASELPLRIAHALSADGPLLDAAVIDLTTDGETGAQMVLVVKGNPGATPEQLRRAINASEEIQRHLRNLPNDEDPEAPTANEA